MLCVCVRACVPYVRSYVRSCTRARVCVCVVVVVVVVLVVVVVVVVVVVLLLLILLLFCFLKSLKLTCLRGRCDLTIKELIN